MLRAGSNSPNQPPISAPCNDDVTELIQNHADEVLERLLQGGNDVLVRARSYLAMTGRDPLDNNNRALILNLLSSIDVNSSLDRSSGYPIGVLLADAIRRNYGSIQGPLSNETHAPYTSSSTSSDCGRELGSPTRPIICRIVVTDESPGSPLLLYGDSADDSVSTQDASSVTCMDDNRFETQGSPLTDTDASGEDSWNNSADEGLPCVLEVIRNHNFRRMDVWGSASEEGDNIWSNGSSDKDNASQVVGGGDSGLSATTRLELMGKVRSLLDRMHPGSSPGSRRCYSSCGVLATEDSEVVGQPVEANLHQNLPTADGDRDNFTGRANRVTATKACHRPTSHNIDSVHALSVASYDAAVPDELKFHGNKYEVSISNSCASSPTSSRRQTGGELTSFASEADPTIPIKIAYSSENGLLTDDRGKDVEFSASGRLLQESSSTESGLDDTTSFSVLDGSLHHLSSSLDEDGILVHDDLVLEDGSNFLFSSCIKPCASQNSDVDGHWHTGDSIGMLCDGSFHIPPVLECKVPEGPEIGRTETCATDVRMIPVFEADLDEVSTAKSRPSSILDHLRTALSDQLARRSGGGGGVAVGLPVTEGRPCDQDERFISSLPGILQKSISIAPNRQPLLQSIRVNRSTPTTLLSSLSARAQRYSKKLFGT